LEEITMRPVFVTLLAGAAAVLMASPAAASLIYNSQIQLSAQGFGNAPKDLTLQGKGTTSGCVGTAAGGGITFGTCTTDAQTFMGNGLSNLNGTTSMPSPLKDDLKYGNPTVSELGFTSAADIGVLFNATEPAGNSINVADITLSFYNTLSGNLLAAIDGQQNFLDSFAGNGVAGFVFMVDQDQQTYLNNLIFNGTNNLSNTRIGLGATLVGAAGGPDSFAVVNLSQPGGVPEPATWAMMLLGMGGLGAALRQRRRPQMALSATLA
jgi:hypothetical protein